MYIGKTPVDYIWMRNFVQWDKVITMDRVTSTHGELMCICGSSSSVGADRQTFNPRSKAQLAIVFKRKDLPMVEENELCKELRRI